MTDEPVPGTMATVALYASGGPHLVLPPIHTILMVGSCVRAVLAYRGMRRAGSTLRRATPVGSRSLLSVAHSYRPPQRAMGYPDAPYSAALGGVPLIIHLWQRVRNLVALSPLNSAMFDSNGLLAFLAQAHTCSGGPDCHAATPDKVKQQRAMHRFRWLMGDRIGEFMVVKPPPREGTPWDGYGNRVCRSMASDNFGRTTQIYGLRCMQTWLEEHDLMSRAPASGMARFPSNFGGAMYRRDLRSGCNGMSFAGSCPLHVTVLDPVPGYSDRPGVLSPGPYPITDQQLDLLAYAIARAHQLYTDDYIVAVIREDT